MKQKNNKKKYTVNLSYEEAQPEIPEALSSKYNTLLFAILLLVFAFSSILIQIQLSKTKDIAVVPTEVVPVEDVAIVPTESFINPFDSIEILAYAAYVYDVKSDTVLYSKNETDVWALASLTKIMTALVAEMEFKDDLAKVVVHAPDLYQEGNSGLLLDEQWNFKDLLNYTLITSSNDGASAIAAAAGARLKRSSDEKDVYTQFLNEKENVKKVVTPTFSATTSTSSDLLVVSTTTKKIDYEERVLLAEEENKTPKDFFVDQMNTKAKEIGLKKTVFYNESGLDISREKGGAYGTAEEVALLLQYVIENYPLLLTPTQKLSEIYVSDQSISHNATNTNFYAHIMPGLRASKTGYTDLAGGNLGVVFDSSVGTPIIVVVLGSTVEGRFIDVQELISASIDKVAQVSRN